MSFNPNFVGDSTESSAAISNKETNNSGVTITKLTPVHVNASGDIEPVDVSIESQVFAVLGLTKADILNGAEGTVSEGGRIANITRAEGFGTLLYISKTGTLTSSKPEIGVDSFTAGDFVVSMGLIRKNRDNPVNKDFSINIRIEGQL